METKDLKKIKLPLTRERFTKLRNAIKKGQVKWLDMSTKLMYAYQDFWKRHKLKSHD